MSGKLLRGLRSVLSRRRMERELDVELRFHLERETEENIRRGMNPADARRAALRSFGGVEQVKEACRDERGGRVIYGVLLRPLPYENGERLMTLKQQAPLAGVDNLGFSVKEITDYRAQTQTLDEVVEYHAMSFTLFGRSEPERIQTGVVSANFFDVLGVKPKLGRSFLASDEQHGADAVLILSHDYWERSHHSDPGIVGKVFRMNNRPHTVIGVLPPIPEFPDNNDVYMATLACPTRSSEQFKENRRFIKLQQVSPGFDPERVMVMRLSPNWSKCTTNQQYRDFSLRLLDRVKPLPGVLTAAIASNHPLNPQGIARGPFNRNFIIEGRPVAESELAPQADFRVVSPDYLQTIRLPLIQGRFFTESDDDKTTRVVVINQTLARHRWDNEDPVGRRISFNRGETWLTVAGVIGDSKNYRAA